MQATLYWSLKKYMDIYHKKVTIDIPPNIRNAQGDLRVVVKRNHSAGDVGLRSYVTNISYAKYAVAPNGTNEVSNVIVDKRNSGKEYQRIKYRH